MLPVWRADPRPEMMATTTWTPKELDSASFSRDVDGSLTSLRWLLVRPLPCDFSIPGANGGGSQPSGHHHHQQPPVFRCHQPGSSEKPLSPLAGDLAPTNTTPAVCNGTQQSLTGIVPHDTHGRPKFTYPMLICMAMQASGTRQTTVSYIYQWMMENFSYYRLHRNPDSWKSSVRHNLCTIKEFTTLSRMEDDSGKGGYWTVNQQYAERILLRAFNKRMTSIQIDPALQSPPLESPPLESPPLESPPLESGRLKRKRRDPDSRSKELGLDSEEPQSKHSHPPPPIQQPQGPELCSDATSTVPCVPPSPPSSVQHQVSQLLGSVASALSGDPSLGSGQSLSTSHKEDNLADLDFQDSALSGELSVDSRELLSSTSPIEEDLTYWDLDMGCHDLTSSRELSLDQQLSHQPGSSEKPLSPLAGDLAPTKTTPAGCSGTQQSLTGIVPHDAHGRPKFTYPMLICMAMQASGTRQTTVSYIYQWMMDNFSYYRLHRKPDSWKSSVRHNLCTSKEFTTLSRMEDDSRKGGYWTVNQQYAERILLRAFNKRMTSIQIDPALQSPPLESPPLESPPLESPPLESPPLESPPLESGRLKRKRRGPDSTACMAKVPHRAERKQLGSVEEDFDLELDGYLDWVVSKELGLDSEEPQSKHSHPPPPIQQPQGPELCSDATSTVPCVPPSPPSSLHHQLSQLLGSVASALSGDPSLGSGQSLSTSHKEDNLADLDFQDSALSGELSVDSSEPLSSTSPIDDGAPVDWNAFLSAWK